MSSSASEPSGIDDGAEIDEITGSVFTAGTKAPVDPSSISVSEDGVV